jgi:hypothetical protein
MHTYELAALGAAACWALNGLIAAHPSLYVGAISFNRAPPKVEYAPIDWGQALCPALDAVLKWAALREKMANGVTVANKE